MDCYIEGTPTIADLYAESEDLTETVFGAPVVINTNGTFAIEKQAAIPICYGSALSAWNAAVNYSGTSSNYPNKTFDNVGWVRGTKSANGDWGAYLWVLQNRIAFQSSTSAWWTATNGISVAITNVMVGSLGDYGPVSDVVDIGPGIPTNFPGANYSDFGIYQVDIANVFYELVIPDIWITPREAVGCVGGSNVQFTVTGTNIPQGVNWAIIPDNLTNGARIVSNNSWQAEITPGSMAANYQVRATAKNNTNFYDQVNLAVVKVESIDATSPKSGTSSNPPPFEGHKPWPFDVTHSPNPDKHMVVFYKDVIDSSFNVQDFDITLKANLLPSSVSADQLNKVWSKISGPNSGNLNRTDTFEVKYQNPKQGGVCRFDFDLGFSSLAKSEANVVLPLAGAEVDSIVSADIPRADTFATTVRANYTWVERQYTWNGRRWFVENGAGDYLGRPDNASTPTAWAYNQVNISFSDEFGMGAVGTWKGKPIRVAKISNFMVGYGANKIGVNPVSAWFSQVIGTWNDSASSKSWDAGWDIAGGASYDTTVTVLVADIWDEADEKNQKLWPNSNATDNYLVPNSFWDPDRQFTSPGFLYMTNP